MRLYTCIDPHRLKKVLDDKGIDPLKFARKIGMPSNRFMSYLSKAYKYPDFNEIKNIAEGLGVGVESITTVRPETIGWRIARLRLARNLTRNQLAEQISVSEHSVYNWEILAHENIQARCLENLANYFGVTVQYLLHGDTISCSSQLAMCDLIAAAGYEMAGIPGGFHITGQGVEFNLDYKEYNLICEQVQILMNNLLREISIK